MQLLVDQSGFSKALQVIGRVVPKRPISPVLGSVVVSAADGRVRLRATDLHCYADVSLPAEVHLPGTAAVYARVLADAAATLPKGMVAISRSDSGGSLRVTGGTAAFRLRTIDPEGFPDHAVPTRFHVSVDRDRLVDLVARTTFCAVDSDDVSPFAGVLIRSAGGLLTMAATDSYQLAHYRVAADVADQAADDPAGEVEAVLPTGGLNLLSRALQSFGGEVIRIAWERGTVVFSTEGLSWSIRCLDVHYPDMSRYTGPLAGVKVRVERDRLLECVRQVSSLGGEGYRSVGLELKGDRLSFYASERDLGEAQSVIPLEKSYPPRRVWLDARRLANALRAQPDDAVILCVSEPLGPVAVVPASQEIDFRTILMPLRTLAAESEAI